MKKYLKDGKECILCKIRNKLIVLTPEEIVRQNYIQKLVDDHHVPIQSIEVEVPLSHYQKGAKGRADIVVNLLDNRSNQQVTAVVVECKAKSVPITDKTVTQADRYEEVIQPLWVVLTNGIETLIQAFDWEAEMFKWVDSLPTYKKLKHIENVDFLNDVDLSPEIDSNKSGDELINELVEYGVMGEDSRAEIAPLLNHLRYHLIDHVTTIKHLELKTRKFIRDGGIRYTTFGNAGGGSFPGLYRFFILEDSLGNTDIVSLTIASSGKTVNDAHWGNRKGATYIMVAIDSFEKSHMSLEYNIDRFIQENEEGFNFPHDGTMTAGKRGRLKNKIVVDFISGKLPKLIQNEKIELGSIQISDDISTPPEGLNQLIENLIDYAMLRDEIR